jgi:Di- and tricarboxylate transporters
MILSVLDPRDSTIPGLALALLIGALSVHSGYDYRIALTAAIAMVCIMWWVFEPVPIPVTSLVPIALFPMLGILEPQEVSDAYGSPLILLLMGGFLLSRGMESSGAHRRLALGVVRLVGNHSPRRLVFGFMLAGAVLSMWISNTATVLMLMPVAIAVLDSTDRRDALQVPLLLGVACACSIGGLGTPIGTTPNLIFMQVYQEYTGYAVGFSHG